MAEEWIIETHDLVKKYGEHVALDGVNINVRPGATGLLGPNGAGKSTLLKTVLGLIALTSGGGKVLGHDIATEGAKIRQRIGYMPEYDCLTPEMEAIHQVRYAGELLGMNPTVATQRAHDSHDAVQRVARCLVNSTCSFQFGRQEARPASKTIDVA